MRIGRRRCPCWPRTVVSLHAQATPPATARLSSAGCGEGARCSKGHRCQSRSRRGGDAKRKPAGVSQRRCKNMARRFGAGEREGHRLLVLSKRGSALWGPQKVVYHVATAKFRIETSCESLPMRLGFRLQLETEIFERTIAAVRFALLQKAVRLMKTQIEHGCGRGKSNG